MTLEERLVLAREIAARTPPRFVMATHAKEARRMRFEKAKERSMAIVKWSLNSFLLLTPCLQATRAASALVAKGPIGSSSPW
jgi:phosphoserine phosphatase